MTSKEQQMAALGARMLAPEKKAAETAETAGIRRGGENSVLSSLAGSVSMSVEKALRFMAEWGGLDPEKVTFSLNRDFLPMPMDSAMLRELVAAWQSGMLSLETAFGIIQAGEIVPEDLTFEDEQERKESEPPPLGMTDDIGADDDDTE
jgi:hypothetical protein